MKTSEFVKRIKEMGFKVVDGESKLFVKTNSGITLASIDKEQRYSFRVLLVNIIHETQINVEELADLIYKYSSTSIFERTSRQEKKYCLRHRYMIDSYGTGFNHLGVDRRTHSVSFINSKHDGDNIQTAFTLDEIEELKENFNTDFSDFEIMEYGVSEYENK